MSEGMANAKILPIRPAVGFAVVSLIAAGLAVLTARDADRNLELHQELHHLQTPFAPSLLYGCVVWIWWVVVMLVLWNLANRWAAAFKPSTLTVMAHLGAACVLATAHLALLERTIRFASWYWPAWGRRYGGLLRGEPGTLRSGTCHLRIHQRHMCVPPLSHADTTSPGSKAGGRAPANPGPAQGTANADPAASSYSTR